MAETNIHALGEHRSLVVAVGNADADGRRARPRRRPRVHGDHHKLVQVIGPFVVQASGGVDHAPRRHVKVGTQDEVGQQRVQARVAVTGGHCKRRRRVRTQAHICRRTSAGECSTLQQRGPSGHVLRDAVSAVDGVQELGRTVVLIRYLDDHLQSKKTSLSSLLPDTMGSP